MSSHHLEAQFAEALAAASAASSRERRMAEDLTLAQDQLLQYLDEEAVIDEEHVHQLEQATA